MTEQRACRISAAYRVIGVLLVVFVLVALSSCGRHHGANGKAGKGGLVMDSTLVITMLGDADYLNPVIGTTVTSSHIR